jgi:organic hydroperoxide reductase OsmC/OhrA
MIMKISATVGNSGTQHVVTVCTDGNARPLAIPGKASGQGSGVNGGELLMLALATCYGNDLCREAARMGITLDAVEVEASATFPGVGLAATDIRYRARVSSSADASSITELLRRTDAVAEVHNTLRAGASVTLVTD